MREYISEPNGSEFYFDTMEGRLIVGRVALDECIEAGADPLSIFDLDILLTSENTLIEKESFPAMPYDQWDSANTIPVAKWLHSITTTGSTQKPLSEKIMTQAGYMGIIPRINYFKRVNPGGLSALYNDAELQGIRTRNLFNSWTTADYVSYVNKLATEVGGKPTWQDVKDASIIAGNPGERQIIRKFGGFGALFELAGYPNVRAWDTQDFIDWGVRFTKANNGNVPTTSAMKKLSAMSLGPNPTSIYDNVDSSFKIFQAMVLEEYERDQARLAFEQEEKLSTIKAQIEDGTFPEALLICSETEQELLGNAARFYVLKNLLPDIDQKHLLTYARIKRQSWFVSAIQRTNTAISAGRIEETAVILGVFDDIWPFDDYMQTLKIDHRFNKK